MKRQVRRALAISAVAAAALVVVVLLALHLGFVQTRVLDYAAGLLAEQNIVLAADDFDYNLATRRVTLRGLRLAAAGHEDRPFLTADLAEVYLPWAIFTGNLRLNSVALTGAAVTIESNADGVMNLPESDEPEDPDAEPLTLPIGALDIDGLDFVFRDLPAGFEVSALGIHADLDGGVGVDGIEGPFVLEQGFHLRLEDQRMDAARVESRLGFDGTNVRLAGLGLDLAEGDFTMNGRIDAVMGDPTFDMTFEGTARLAEAAAWADPPVAVSGPAEVEGRFSGPLDAYKLELDASGSGLGVGEETGVTLRAGVTLTPALLTVESATIRPPTGGRLDARVRVPLGDEEAEGPLQVDAEWEDLDARTAQRMAGLEARPVGASLTGTLQFRRPEGAPYELTASNRTRPLEGAGLVPIGGRLDATIENGRWRANQGHRMGALSIEGTVQGAFDDEDPVRSTLGGGLTFVTSDLGQTARTIQALGVEMPDVVRESDGRIEGKVALDGTFGEPRAVGNVRGEGIDMPSVAPVTFTADLDASGRAVRLTGLDARAGTAALTGNVLVGIEANRLDGEIRLDAPQAADIQGLVPEDYRLEGSLNATAALGGTLDRFRIDVAASGTKMTFAGQPVDSLDAKARLTNTGVDVSRLELTQGAGGLSGTARYNWDTGAYAADLKGNDLTWRGEIGTAGETEATLSLTFAGEGTLDDPGGQGQVAFDLTGGTIGTIVDRGTLDLRFVEGRALLTGRVPSLGAFLSGQVATAAPYPFDLVTVVHRVELAPLAALGGARFEEVSGTASLTATTRGTVEDLENAYAYVNLQELDASMSGVPLGLPEPGRVAWTGGALSLEALALSVGSGRLQASGRIETDGGGDWRAAFQGEVADLVQAGRAFGVPPELAAQGDLAFDWRTAGEIDASTATLTLMNGELVYEGVPPVTGLAMHAGFDGRTIEVTRLTGAWQDGGIDGTASIPRAVFDGTDDNGGGAPARGFAKLQLTGLTEEAFAPWMGPDLLEGIDGRLSATLDADILGTSVDDIVGTLTLTEGAFVLAGLDVAQVRPSVFALRDGVLSLKDVEWRAGPSPLTLSGDVPLDGPDGPSMDVAIKGPVDLRILSAFAPDVAAGGVARIDLTAAGPVSSPRLLGRIGLDRMEIGVDDPRIIISGLTGAIVFDENRMRFAGIAGNMNGGSVSLDGRLDLDGAAIAGGQLVAQLQRIALELPEGLQSEVDGLVRLQPGPDAWSIGGDVRILRSAYTEPISLAALAAENRARVRTGEPSALDATRLNLNVTTVQDMQVDNNYGRFQASAALRVVGTIGDPGLVGRVTLREGGEVFIAGNTLQLDRGNISFVDPSAIQPDLDIVARSRVGGTDIQLAISGTPDNLTTDVRAINDPNVSRGEAIGLLLGTSGGLTGADAATLLSAEILGTTGRALGLDTLRIQRGFAAEDVRSDPGLIATETDPSARLTLSKRLRPNVELTLSQSLRESGALSTVLSYNPIRNVELRAVSRDNIDRSFAVRHEVIFGQQARLEAEEQADVAEIRFEGELLRPEAEVREGLRLKPGDTFSFYEWQDDIDDLVESLQERGRYEARVEGDRETNQAGAYVLTYRVEPGPETVLAVEGYDLPGRVRDDLVEVWSGAVFDQFLLRDLEERVRRHLVTESVLDSTIEAEVTESTSARKAVTVRIAPGTRVTSREVRYEGNETIARDRLDETIDAAGLRLEGWLDPPAIEDELEAYYRREGYLRATVDAGEPRAEGDVGVLPVTIDEGPRFVVAGVAFNGVAQDRLPLVQEAAALPAGEPYLGNVLDEARRRVERAYRARGYNQVRVDAEAQAVDGGAVSVTFNVDEGRQQVLHEVVTQGATRTRDGVIEDALKLTPGEPVDLTQWAQARKRLYDTNVFREVDIEPVPAPDAPEPPAGVEYVRALVAVQEYPVWRLRYGLQLSDERLLEDEADGRTQSLGVTGELRNQNVFGRAIAAGLAGRFERDRRVASTYASTPSIFGLPAITNVFGFFSQQRFRVDERIGFIRDTWGASTEQRWRPAPWVEVQYGYRFERARTYDPDPAPSDPFPLDFVAKIGKATASLLADRRDDPFNTRDGWFFSANWEQAAEVLGSDFRNARVLLQQYYFRPVGPVVLASRAQLGASYGAEQLVPTNRFFAGGAASVRGFGENVLGPRDFLGQPEGGDGLVVLNQEARFPIRGWVNAVGFVDAGNVFSKEEGISLGDLRVGYGFGLRVDSPFALVRVDFGFPVSPKPDEKTWRWYIGIGHIF